MQVLGGNEDEILSMVLDLAFLFWFVKSLHSARHIMYIPTLLLYFVTNEENDNQIIKQIS